MNTKVINIFGGPGTGKSTTASGLFSFMKKHGHSVEYVTEVAKEYAWEEVDFLQEHQLSIFAEQVLRMKRPAKHVEFLITDAPLLQFLGYTDDEPLRRLIVSEFKKFNNINFYIKKDHGAYKAEGRYQTKEEAIQLNNTIYSIVVNNCRMVQEVSLRADYTFYLEKIREYERANRERT